MLTRPELKIDLRDPMQPSSHTHAPDTTTLIGGRFQLVEPLGVVLALVDLEPQGQRAVAQPGGHGIGEADVDVADPGRAR